MKKYIVRLSGEKHKYLSEIIIKSKYAPYKIEHAHIF